MAPLPRLCASEPLEAGQTTIFGALNGSLSLTRPPPPPRPGRTPKWSGQADTVLGQRIVGRQNEKQVVELFATVRLAQSDDAKPGDIDIANSITTIEEDKDKFKYILR
jgi:hypothetical protein